jgi:lauroyl/myristoyl acyltransferase
MFLVKLVACVFAIIPDPLAMLCARILNLFFYPRLKKGRWKFVKTHRVIPKLFAEQGRHWQERVIRQNSLHYMKLMMEILKTRHITKRGGRKKIYIKEGKEHFERLLESGKGFVIITGHLGNFEYAAGYIGTFYRPIYAPISVSNTGGSRAVNWMREGHNVTFIEVPPRRQAASRALLHMIRLLKRGEIIFLVADQKGTGKGYRGNLFGKEVKLYGGPFTLGQRTGVLFLPLYTVRDDKNRIAIHFMEPFPLTGEDISADIKKVTDFFEFLMREHPDQYLWDRDRW